MKAQAGTPVQRSLALCAALSCAFSACSSDSQHPSRVQDTGGVSNGNAGSVDSAGLAGIDSGGAGAGGETENAGGSRNAGGEAGNGGDAAAPTLEVGGSAPTPGPATCSQMPHWAAASPLEGVSSPAAETLLSITLDELDLAFLRAGTLYVAHRASQTAPFSAITPVTLPAGWSALHGASLSADGKRLLLVSDPDQKKLGELTRATREQTFSGEVDETAFSGVNGDALYTGKIYAAPVVSGGDDQLIFNSAYLDAASTVVYSTRVGSAPWSAPRQLQAKLLDGGPTTRRLPTGLSADPRTLFYFNEETMQEEGRFRAASLPSSPLYDLVNLGARRGAAPNASCNHLYSDADSDVVVEKD
ncbi:MAG: hypothetical protein ABJB12_13915 [Pseudomonadota bacterium]